MTTDFVTLFENVLPADICDHIIQTFEASPDAWVEREVEGLRQFTEIGLCDHGDRFKHIYNLVFSTVQQHLPKYKSHHNLHPSQFPTKYGLEGCRMKRYLPNHGYFNPHVDVADLPSSKRFLVTFLYLNDVEEGGETMFLTPNQFAVKPKRGSLIMFPPLWTHLHSGAVPKSGPKYIIGTYLNYV